MAKRRLHHGAEQPKPTKAPRHGALITDSIKQNNGSTGHFQYFLMMPGFILPYMHGLTKPAILLLLYLIAKCERRPEHAHFGRCYTKGNRDMALAAGCHVTNVGRYAGELERVGLVTRTVQTFANTGKVRKHTIYTLPWLKGWYELRDREMI